MCVYVCIIYSHTVCFSALLQASRRFLLSPLQGFFFFVFYISYPITYPCHVWVVLPLCFSTIAGHKTAVKWVNVSTVRSPVWTCGLMWASGCGYLHFPGPWEAPAPWQTPRWCETPRQRSAPPSAGSAAAAGCLLEADRRSVWFFFWYTCAALPNFVFCFMLPRRYSEPGLNSAEPLPLPYELCRKD